MGLKDNFYQALREVLSGNAEAAPESAAAASGSTADAVKQKEFSQRPSEPVGRDVPDGSEQPAFSAASMEKESEASSSGHKIPFSNPTNDSVTVNLDSDAVEEITFISKSTMVTGNVRSFANATIEGNVRGDVSIMKDAVMKGMLIGDLSCKNALLQGSSVQGNIKSKGNTLIDNHSTVLGDLEAQYACIDGRVKGNISVGGKIEFLENAVVAGNIYTNALSVAEGANIQGFVSTAYLGENADSAFPSQIVIEEDSFVMK